MTTTKATAERFCINTPRGLVAGFSQAYGVQTAGAPEYVKTWATRGQAEKFINKYADCGYGFDSSSAKVEVVSASRIAAVAVGGCGGCS